MSMTVNTVGSTPYVNTEAPKKKSTTGSTILTGLGAGAVGAGIGAKTAVDAFTSTGIANVLLDADPGVLKTSTFFTNLKVGMEQLGLDKQARGEYLSKTAKKLFDEADVDKLVKTANANSVLDAEFGKKAFNFLKKGSALRGALAGGVALGAIGLGVAAIVNHFRKNKSE